MGLFEKSEHRQTDPEEEAQSFAELSPAFADAKRFLFSTHDPLNRTISEVHGGLAFKIQTKSSRPLFGSDITTILRVEGGLETEVAKIDWKHYEPDRAELRYSNTSNPVKLWDYLAASGPRQFAPQFDFKAKRRFRVKEAEYTWTWTDGPQDRHLELLDSHDTPLARDIRETGGFFIPYTRSGGLLVNPPALDLFNEIIVTHTAIAQMERMSNASRRDMGAAALNQTLKF